MVSRPHFMTIKWSLGHICIYIHDFRPHKWSLGHINGVSVTSKASWPHLSKNRPFAQSTFRTFMTKFMAIIPIEVFFATFHDVFSWIIVFPLQALVLWINSIHTGRSLAVADPGCSWTAPPYDLLLYCTDLFEIYTADSYGSKPSTNRSMHYCFRDWPITVQKRR